MDADPNITVRIAPSVHVHVATPMVGSVYSLTGTVTGTERLTVTDAMVTYQWFKNGELVSVDTPSFQTLNISDAGSYTCQATVTSSLLSAPISCNSTNTVRIAPITLLCESINVTVNFLN